METNCLCIVSIPQAVGVVATSVISSSNIKKPQLVSIPQAVGVVATRAGLTEPVFMGLKIRFWKTSYRKRSKRSPI